MSRLLVCPPDYYGIEYEINPWMRISDVTDSEKSKSQWYNLMKTLEDDVGVELERMIPIKGCPDLVFTANAGVVVDKLLEMLRSGLKDSSPLVNYIKRLFPI